MRWTLAAWLALLLLLPCHLARASSSSSSRLFTDERRVELREQVRELFRHGYEGYMKYAYPADELRPVTCGPLHRDPTNVNFGINDIHPNASITLLDVLSSLPLVLPSEFPDAVRRVATEVSFDQDVKVQVFEMTIRALGSLLSTYQYLDRLPDEPVAQARGLGLTGKTWAAKKAKGVDVKQYRGRLLEMALDLGKRLLPAFNTVTGLPYARVNLRKGVDKGETVETCTAGAGSLVLEFAVLSRLTGDERFEALAQRAYLAIWNRRSTHNLVGNTIGVSHGHWLAPGLTGVGAGIDSYFEYGIKAAILLDDDVYLDIFQDTYAAIQTHVRTPDGFIYRPIQFRLLQPGLPSTIDSLSAFLPGMQVLAGDIESAIRSHLVWWNLWRKYDALPETWIWQERKIEWAGWPGRPEFIESTYYLYQATRDPFYLRVGERVLNDLRWRTKTKCGFATLKNVATGELEDRMESFMLSETLKYLFLLFDPAPATPPTNRVFTTEGHGLSLPSSKLHKTSATRRAMHRGEDLFCPAYEPPTLGGLVVGIERRVDYEYARSLVFGWGVDGRVIEDKESVHWWEGGFCSLPSAPTFSFDIVLTPLNATDQEVPPEDPAPSASKVRRDEATGDFVVADVSGLRLSVRWRLDNRGYDVASIGPHRVRPGQQVFVTDQKMEGYLPIPANPPATLHAPPEVLLRFSTISSKGERAVFLHAAASTATFGKSFGSAGSAGFGIGGLGMLIRPKVNVDGCRAFKPGEIPEVRGVLVLDRGECPFLTKTLHARMAGMDGVLLVGLAPTPPELLVQDPSTPGAGVGAGSGGGGGSQTEGLIRPSADGEPDELLHRVSELGVVYVEHIVGQVVLRMMEVERKAVAVEMMLLEAEPAREDLKAGGAGGGGREKAREGKVMVNDWEIWNLRILERPP